jgi:MFS family permease
MSNQENQTNYVETINNNQSSSSDFETEKYTPQNSNELEENENNDLTLKKTITVRSSHHDYSNVANFQNSASNDKENEYQDELESELQREATNISKLSRILTGRKSEDFQDLEKHKVDENEDPEIVGYEPRTVEWDSPDDPDNPLNWPQWKRWYCTMTTAFLCLVITLGSSIYVDAVPEMMAKWGTSQTLGLAGLTFYLVGLAFGPAISAPLSELFGRKIVYCSSLPVSMLFVMGVGLSPNIGSVLVLRFFSGLTSSGALAIAGGTITDVWRPQEIGLAMTLFCLAPLAGPVIGPIIGGFVCENKISSNPHRVGGLRWAMWVNLFFAATVFIPLFLMPETYKPIIMRKRLIKRGKKIRKTMGTLEFLTAIVFITLLKPIEMLFVEPIVLVFSIYTAFVFAVLFGFFEAFPVIFRGIYHMSLGVSGLPFLGVGLGLLLGAMLYLCLDKFYFFKKWDDGYIGMKDKNGKPISPTPESRLLPCKIGSVTFGPSLFWLAWTARYSVHWMAPTASGVMFGFSLVLIFFSILTYFSMAYPPISVASALAANNMTRYIVSSVFPLFTVQMMENLHVYWGVSVFAFIALAMIPVPWIFSIYGERLRNRSKYGWTAMLKQMKEAEKMSQSSESEDEKQDD